MIKGEKMKATNYIKSSAIAMSALLVSLSLVHAVVIAPVDYDFGTGAGQEDPTAPSSDFDITLDGVTAATSSDAFGFSRSQDPNFGQGIAVVDTNITRGTNFSMRSDTVSVEGAGPSLFTRYGFTFLGDGGDSFSAFFFPLQGDHGQLRIARGLDVNFGSTFGANFNRSEGTAGSTSVQSFYLDGVYDSLGDLTLTFSVVDLGDSPNATNTVVRTIDSDTLDGLTLGSEFGVGGRIQANTDPSVLVEFDNLSIVPEPSIALLGGLGLLVLFRRRRR